MRIYPKIVGFPEQFLSPDQLSDRIKKLTKEYKYDIYRSDIFRQNIDPYMSDYMRKLAAEVKKEIIELEEMLALVNSYRQGANVKRVKEAKAI